MSGYILADLLGPTQPERPRFDETFWVDGAPEYTGVLVREEPSLDAETVGEVSNGETVRGLSETFSDGSGGEWREVRYGNLRGFVRDELLSTSAPEQQVAYDQTLYVDATPLDPDNDGANFRSGPSLDATIIQLIPNGEAVEAAEETVLSDNGDPFYPVRYGGREGYVLAAALTGEGSGATEERPAGRVQLSGAGQTVTEEFTLPSPISRVRFMHDGVSSFIVTVFGGEEGEDLLVNEIGSYEGTRPIFGEGPYYLEIQADGEWRATIEAVPTASGSVSRFEGNGDAVSDLFEPDRTGPVPYDVSHDGESNFVVYLLCAGGDELIQNEIGRVSGSIVVRFSDGPCIWEIQADGRWLLRPR